MAENKYIMFFRSEINQELLVGTTQRIEILEQIEELNSFQNIEGINFFKEWKNILDTITRLWQKDLEKGLPFFKLETIILDKLAFYFDIVAQFFLYNGSEIDNDYLKNVDDFFVQHKIQRGDLKSKELFHKAFKSKED